VGRKRADTVLSPVGDPLEDREWVTGGVIPDGSQPVALIERGYEFQGGVDEALSDDWGVPVDSWISFQSTYVHQAGWWPTHTGSGSLFVELLNGGVFRYDNVPTELWQNYVVSPSHGQEQYYVVDRIVYAMLKAPYRKPTEDDKQANYTRTSAVRMF
jgi:hypothetical protein